MTIKEQVRNHIADMIEVEDIYNEEEAKPALKEVADAFNRYYGGAEQRATPNKQEAFTEWLQGLPTEIDILFTWYDIHNKLDQWYNKIPVKPENEANKYYMLVWKEFKNLTYMYGIKFKA